MTQNRAIRLPLERGWKFHLGDIRRWERVSHQVCYDATKAGQEWGDMDVIRGENAWEDVPMPHDWSTRQLSAPENHPSNGFKPRGIGWYLLDFDLPDYGGDAHVRLTFEGVMGEAVVYVNGVLAARNASGYTAFSFDVSDYLLSGERNTLMVSADNTRWEGWWYEGAGIYRPAYLEILPEIHIADRGVFASPQKTGSSWIVRASATLESAGAGAEVRVAWRVLDESGDTVARAEADATLPAFGSSQARGEIPVADPALWSPEAPNLYTLRTALLRDGRETEVRETPLGFREIAFTDHGMFVNGVKTPVRGICCHQDHAGVGIAAPKSVARYRIQKLKAMGCNAYRCAHHCPDEYLLRVCDEMGMLVMAENRHFRASDEVMGQLDQLTLTCRNHPSVFLYSLFNEEPWQGENRGRRMAARMLRRVRALDDTRAVTAAMNGGVLTRENASDVLDVAGMNYFVNDYMTYAARRPGHPMVGTENGPLYATRGVYRTDAGRQEYDSYGLTFAPFGQSLQDTMEKVTAAPHVAGQFIWGGFDYRGEPQPFEWPSVFSHWGLTDNCGFEKDTFYMLKSYYSDPDDLMLHLLPHWNWAAGKMVRICAMTNCDTARLYVNGREIGEERVIQNRAQWRVPFEPGEITCVARKGNRELRTSVSTVGPASALRVTDAAPEKDFDCAILNVRLTDAHGRPVPLREADRPVSVRVLRGTLAGSGNGDPNGVQSDAAETIHTFMGMCQFLVKPDGEGRVLVEIRAEGLPAAEIRRGH